MQQLAKECVKGRRIYINRRINFERKYDELINSIKDEIANCVGKKITILLPDKDNLVIPVCCELSMQVTIFFNHNNRKWQDANFHKHESQFTETDKKFIACAQSIVDKLNGKE